MTSRKHRTIVISERRASDSSASRIPFTFIVQLGHPRNSYPVEIMFRDFEAARNERSKAQPNPANLCHSFAWAQSDNMIPEAIRIPLDDLEKHLSQTPKTRPVVAYCTWSNEAPSSSLARKLQAKGYKNVCALQGGFDAWRNSGLQVAQKRAATRREPH